MSRRSSYVLMNPGPVNTSSRVKSALVEHDISHRDPAYCELHERLTSKLRRIFRGGPGHEVLVITGSGTAAGECAIASTLPAGRMLLVVDNGAFGERLAEIAAVHGIGVVHLKYELGAVVDIADVRRALEANPKVAAVAMCHHETSVGLLNPVTAVGALCREFDVLFLVDAVSSLGGEDLDVVRDRIDVCWSSANKCLHAVSGVVFLCVSERVWPRIEAISARVFYLDLKRYRRFSIERSQTPFTPAVASFFALDAACDEYLEEGFERRQDLYATRNARLREGLRRLGFRFFTENGWESRTILIVALPTLMSFDDLYVALRERGFLIYNCKPPLEGRYFQIANMGELPDGSIDAFLEAMAEVASSHCHTLAGA